MVIGIEMYRAVRRVQETGKGTLIVSLPKQWARRWGVRKGSLVEVRDRGDGRLVIDPAYGEREPSRRALIRYPVRRPEHLAWGIIGAYLLGYDVITVYGGRIGGEDRARIEEAIRKLIGLEVMEETATKVEIHCIIDPSLLDPKRILQRMCGIVVGMLKDIYRSISERDRGLAGMVRRRDDDLDRLYFLTVRVLRAAAGRPGLAEELGLTPIECLDFRVAANLLETNGDIASNMAREVEELETPISGDMVEALRPLFEEAAEMQLKALGGFLSSDVGALSEVRSKLSRLVEGLEKVRDRAGELPALISIASYMEEFGRNCVDLADLIAPVGIIEGL